MSDKRNRPKIEGRSSPEGLALVERIREKLPEGANKSDVFETAIRLLADALEIDTGVKSKMAPDTVEAVRVQMLLHFDRTRVLYERARFEASSKGGINKRENAAMRGGAEQ